MEDNKITSYVNYNKVLKMLKGLWESGILELETCNCTLEGIAKELEIINPILI